MKFNSGLRFFLHKINYDRQINFTKYKAEDYYIYQNFESAN